jgi:hypothetical protein
MIIGMHKTESLEVAGTLGLVSVKALSIIHYTLAFCASLRMLDLELGFDLLNAKLRADCPDLCRRDDRQLVEAPIKERAAVVAPAIGRASVWMYSGRDNRLPVKGENFYHAARRPAGYVPILMVEAILGAEECLKAPPTDAHRRGVDVRYDGVRGPEAVSS